ncbi:hypothetical protein BBO99_00008693 [Phytophthora kernoviae]|uniref:Uncharacterized protein n=2 Tax=Phytophthora kernoviae TaxID=325452 RepID=A0A3R7G0X1_9STRA|nr:hypothetical protein G195_009974 [Phytophthora kernoviae 00238/432]KAG2514188.1 hypothetical protein JM18_008365 [Phytophthora kernoviae]RLN14067.1 hypothetical protein BBI17_008666 [Phytophthora kernoviae]RLN74869.1 hypothetical protein BBO99_00008693 [Phytophthora kernoviae]
MKKQKCTYAARREEAEELRKVVSLLSSELQELRIRSLSPEDRALLDPVVQNTVAENNLLTSVTNNQQLGVANAQSLLSQCLGGQESHPLYTNISLTKDWDERRATLMAAHQRYETAEGDLCAVHLEVVHFPGVESLQQVWDALQFHYNNIEIDISEQLGDITVRDDYDSIKGSVYNTHVLSQTENCTPIESSIVTFSHLFTENDEGFGGQACGILALDSIDDDELYPYLPSERVRLDTSGAVVLTARIRPKILDPKQGENKTASPDVDDEIVVTLRRAAFLKLYNPGFPMPEAARQELQVGIGRWGDVMIKTIRSYLCSVS